jgi:hypothetical protein
MVLASGLRFPTTQRGFFQWDEAQFFFSVQPGVLAVREAVGIKDWPRPFQERPPFDTEKVPYWLYTAKPGYDFITTFYGVVMGLTPESVGLLSLMFGLGTILVAYGIARMVFDERIALASALVLSVSSYHVFYSGSQSSVVMSALFLSLGVYLYLSTLESPGLGRLALAGASLAYGYGAHYNLLLYVLVVFTYEGFRIFWNRPAGAVRSFIVFGGAFLAMVGVFELFYRVIIPFAYGHVPVSRGAFLAQLRYQMGVFQILLPSGIERFSRLLLDSEGILVCGLAAVGWVSTLFWHWRDWRKGLLLVLVGAHVVSATFGGLRTSVFPRMVVAILPFLAIWAGVGLVWVVEALCRKALTPARVPVFWICLVLVVVVGAPRTWAVATLQSGHEQQARYVLEHGGGQQVTLNLPVDQYYLGSFSRTYSLPLTLEELRTLHDRHGVRLMVLTYKVNDMEEWGHPLGPLLREFERTASPEAVIANPIGGALVVVGEDGMSPQALDRILTDPLSSKIRIYDLRNLLEGRLALSAHLSGGPTAR